MTMLENAIEVVRMIRDNYFEAYFVGGYVRDFLMNKDPKDIDITTNARPEQILTDTLQSEEACYSIPVLCLIYVYPPKFCRPM